MRNDASTMSNTDGKMKLVQLGNQCLLMWFLQSQYQANLQKEQRLFRQNNSFLLTFHLVQSDKNCLKSDLLGIFAGNRVICLQPFPSSNSEMRICFKNMDTWHLRSNKIKNVQAFLRGPPTTPSQKDDFQDATKSEGKSWSQRREMDGKHVSKQHKWTHNTTQNRC